MNGNGTSAMYVAIAYGPQGNILEFDPRNFQYNREAGLEQEGERTKGKSVDKEV